MRHLTIQREQILQLDLEPIAFKLVKSHDWTLLEALEGVRQYRNFLILIAKYGSQSDSQGISLAPPNETVDEVWHIHILDTLKYFEDCETIFGYYVHHFPYSGMLTEEDREIQISRLLQCRELYKIEFGEDSFEIERFEKKGTLECDHCDNCTPGECGKPCSFEKTAVIRRRPKLSDLKVYQS